MNTNNCYDQSRDEIQISYNEKREQLYLLLDNDQISEDEFNQRMNQISEEEEACYGELIESELEY